MKVSENRPKWLDRCDWCNWPLDPEGVMCRPNDCSLRPMPDVNDTAPERRKTRAYIAELETQLETVIRQREMWKNLAPDAYHTVCEERDRLKAENERLKADADQHLSDKLAAEKDWANMRDERDQLKAENERLTEERAFHVRMAQQFKDDKNEYKADNERLKAELDEAINAGKHNLLLLSEIKEERDALRDAFHSIGAEITKSPCTCVSFNTCCRCKLMAKFQEIKK